MRYRYLLFACALTGCMTPPRPLASPREFIPKERPEAVWVDRDGKEVMLLDPHIQNDSLFGTAYNGEDELKYSLASVGEIRAQQKDKTKTTALIVALTVGGVAGIAVAASQLGSGKGSDADTSMPTMSVAPNGRTWFNVVPLLQFLRR